MSGPFGSTAWMYNASSGFYSHTIDQSCRFEDAFLTKTYGSAGNRRTWTFSVWVKRGKLGVQQNIYNPHDGGGESQMHFLSDDVFRIYDAGGLGLNARTTMKFRDTSAWYHIVVRIDTTNGTAANRVRVYVNGVEQTLSNGGYGTAEPSQNYDTEWNMATLHALGTYATTTANFRYFGYMAEVNMIDGTSLGPDSFGETKNDIWIPKDTSGLTFGTNGFRMKFETSGTLGNDTSGNNNDFASTGLAATDQVPDSPTNNFATYNAVDNPEGATLSEGNLKCTSHAAYDVVLGTIPFSSGKYYWEQNATSGNAVDSLSVATTAIDPDKRGSNTGADTNSVAYYAGNGGAGLIIWNDAVHQGSLAGWGAGDVMSVACDMDNKTIQFRKNNTLIYTASASANGNITNTWNDMIPAWSIGSGVADKGSVVNFGQDSSFAGQETAQGNADENGIGDFYYAPPSGYLALCTANLPDPVETIDPAQGGSPQDYFNTVLWTGNGTDDTSITGVGFQPDWVWVKPRSETDDHYLQDSVRGVTKQLQSDTTAAETSFTNGVKSFASDGFTVGTSQWANGNTKTKVAWNWKAGTVFSNDVSSTGVGSIDSSGSVNTDVGFSIIKWTAVASSATQTMAHGLGAVPKMIIMKNRERAVDWAVYHESLGNTHGMSLNTTAASSDDSGWWNDTTPTSAVFTTGNGNGFRTGGVAEDYIAYCFANVDGYSKFGSYEGNGNADGPMVYTGFRPAFVILVKTAGENWHMKDNKTSPFNVMRQVLDPNRNGAEVADANTDLDFVSNGFKMRASHATQNGDGSTYIYMAFAEQPFKYANAR